MVGQHAWRAWLEGMEAIVRAPICTVSRAAPHTLKHPQPHPTPSCDDLEVGRPAHHNDTHRLQWGPRSCPLREVIASKLGFALAGAADLTTRIGTGKCTQRSRVLAPTLLQIPPRRVSPTRRLPVEFFNPRISRIFHQGFTRVILSRVILSRVILFYQGLSTATPSTVTSGYQHHQHNHQPLPCSSISTTLIQ